MILKNTAVVDKQWASIVVAAGGQYTIQETDKFRLLADLDFLADLTSGVVVINDGVDVDYRTAQDLLNNKTLLYADTYDMTDNDLSFPDTLEVT